MAEDAGDKERPGFFRSLIDFRRWMGVDSIKENAEGISDTINKLRSLHTERRVETFEEAKERLKLSEKQINKRRKQCLYSAWFYIAFSLGLFGYAFHLLLNHHLMSALVSVVLSLVVMVSAYREGFWYYQMTVRKLGCKHKDFLAFITGRR